MVPLVLFLGVSSLGLAFSQSETFEVPSAFNFLAASSLWSQLSPFLGCLASSPGILPLLELILIRYFLMSLKMAVLFECEKNVSDCLAIIVHGLGPDK